MAPAAFRAATTVEPSDTLSNHLLGRSTWPSRVTVTRATSWAPVPHAPMKVDSRKRVGQEDDNEKSWKDWANHSLIPKSAAVRVRVRVRVWVWVWAWILGLGLGLGWA